MRVSKNLPIVLDLSDRSPAQFCVYVYRDPRPSKRSAPIYVGKGSRSTGRVLQHLFRGTNVRLVRSFNVFRKRGLSPIIEIVGWFDSECDAFCEETRLITLYGRRDLGTGTLYNLTNGGEGAAGAIRSPQEVARLRKQWRNGVSARLSAAKRAALNDPARRALICAAISQAHANPSVRRRFLASRELLKFDKLRSEKISQSLSATLAMPEQKALRSAESKKRWADPEFKRKTSAAIGLGNSKMWIHAEGKTFATAAAAAEHLGIHRDTVTMRCRRGIYQRTPK